MNLLPNNWTYAKINDLISNEGIFVDGDWIESKDQNPKGKVRLIQLADIGDGIFRDKSNRYLTKEKSVELGCTYLKKKDILVARLPEPLGRACIFPLNNSQKYITAVDICIIRPENKGVNIKYLLFLINSPIIRIEIDKLKSGTTRKRISRKNFAKIDLPIAPMYEQNRIVEKIEELFSDLDKATGDLKKTQEQLKIYRQAVLKAAFEGKLTEEWRQVRKEASNMEYNTLNKICIKAEKIKTDENSERQIKYLDISSIDNKVFKIISHKTYQIKNAPSRAKQIVKEGDTLFSTVRTYLKNIAYIHSEYDNEICSTGFCVIRPKNIFLSGKYVFYYVISDDFVNRVSPLQTGTSYPAVRDDDILKQTIPLVTIDEQEQIVQEIESRLSVCDKLEETVQKSLEKIGYLRQSILKKAFKGKLVKQDSNGEPAEKLLERIKQEKVKFESNNKKRKKR